MELYELAKQLLTDMGEVSEILEISLVGSSLFKEPPVEPGDRDYLVLCSNFLRRVKFVKPLIDGIRYDLMFYDVNEYLRQITFNQTSIDIDRHSVYSVVYAAIRRVVWGSCDLSWSIFDYEKEYRAFIKDYMYNWIYNPDRRPSVSLSGKMLVTAYLALKIFESKSVEITEEIRSSVQALYQYNVSEDFCRAVAVWIGNQLGLVCQL